MPLRIQQELWLRAVFRLPTQRGFVTERKTALPSYKIRYHEGQSSLKAGEKPSQQIKYLDPNQSAPLDPVVQQLAKPLADQRNTRTRASKISQEESSHERQTSQETHRQRILHRPDPADVIGNYKTSRAPPTADTGAVLFIKAVSSALTAADFRRILPAGKHLPEWRGEATVDKGIPWPAEVSTISSS